MTVRTGEAGSHSKHLSALKCPQWAHLGRRGLMTSTSCTPPDVSTVAASVLFLIQCSAFPYSAICCHLLTLQSSLLAEAWGEKGKGKSLSHYSKGWWSTQPNTLKYRGSKICILSHLVGCTLSDMRGYQRKTELNKTQVLGTVVHTCGSSYSDFRGRSITWTQELKARLLNYPEMVAPACNPNTQET